MTPEELERALRASFAQRAATPPRATDLAGPAVRRGRRIQRGRVITGVAMTALATALITAGAAQLGPRDNGPGVAIVGDPPVTASATDPPASSSPPTPRPSRAEQPPAPDAGPPAMDVVIGTQLVPAAGTEIDLSAVGPVAGIRRTAGGWVTISTPAPGKSSLWFVTANGPPRQVLTGVDAVALAADGQRVAWRDGESLFAGTLAAGRFVTTTDVKAPLGDVPVAFVGVAVLVRTATAGYHLWWPGEGSYEPSGSTSITSVYGSLPDGHTVVGQVPGPTSEPCLALLDASRDLAPVWTACGLPLGSGGRGAVSPDGHWLLANGPAAAGKSGGNAAEVALVVDLKSALRRAPTALAAGARLVSEPAWTDARTAVHLDEQGELVRVAADRVAAGAAGVDRFPVSGAAGGDRPVVVSGTVF